MQTYLFDRIFTTADEKTTRIPAKTSIIPVYRDDSFPFQLNMCMPSGLRILKEEENIYGTS